MFRNVFTKSLRDYRWAILGWGVGLGLLIYFYYATILSQLAGTNGSTLQNVAGQFSFFGETVEANTPGGYITFKIMGTVPVILGIWTLLAGARMTRGEEERGAMDILLSTPQARLTLLVQKILALAAATGVISVLVGLLTLAGMVSARAKLPAEVTVDPGNALMAGINGGVAAFLFGALALLLAQFMSRGASAGWTGGVMVFFYVLEGTGRSVQGASGVRPFTPLYYYDQSLPLVPDHGMNWGAFAVLVALCVVLAGAAVPLFLRRDIGRSVLADTQLRQGAEMHARPAGQVLAQAERDIWLRGIGAQAARQQRTAVFWWIVSLAIFAGFLVYIAKSFEQQVESLIGNNPTFTKVFSGANLGTNNGFLSAVVFPYVTLLVPIFTVFIAYRWATDLDNGRLELTLSTPNARWRVILERYGAVFAAAVLATLVIWLAIVFAAFASNLTIDAGNIAAATFGMLPLELITASLVFALAGLLPPALVIGILAVFLAASFLVDLLRTLWNLPQWVLNLSMFHQYGTPVITGLSWGSFVGLLVVAAALLAIGGWQFSSRDLDRGVVEA
jgi:ABC-2 type transport system permease protein